MRINILHTLACGIAMALGILAASAQSETVFAYAPKTDTAEGAGSGLHETYDLAIALDNDQLVGKRITDIEIPVYASEYISNLRVWIADSLQLDLVDGKKVNVTDRCYELTYPTVGGLQYIKYHLDEPYTIPIGGTYVGYSLTVNELKNFHPETYAPLYLATTSKPGGLYLHTARSFIDWQDRSELLGCVAMTQVYLEGDFMVNAASVGNVGNRYIATGDMQTLTLPVHNIGLEPVTSIVYTTGNSEGGVYSAEIVFDTPIPAVFAYGQTVDFVFPTMTELGQCTLSVSIDSVNGHPNDYSPSTVTIAAKALPFVPVHRAVVEEYTGTWCGWCSRGWVAMELMSQLNPEFVGIAYHSYDPMEISGGYPRLTTGAPSVTIDRVYETDPFYAKGTNSGFKMPELYAEYCSEFVPVGIDLQARYNADGTVTVESSTRWADTAAPGDYALEYVLVADDVYDIPGTGNPLTWSQHNYYSTEPTEPYLEWICSQPDYIFGLHYNDVAILTSGLHGVEGTITDTSIGHDNRHTYVFDTAKALSPIYNNQDLQIGTAKIPFHPDRLRVVAMLLDRSDKSLLGSVYGRVINAAKCNVAYEIDGISDTMAADGQIESVTYTDMRGISVDRPSIPGIYVKTVRYTDGSVKTSKSIIRP